MFFDPMKKDFLKRMILHAAKLPVIYLVLGTLLIALSSINDFYPFTTQYQNIFDITDKVGAIFIALALLRFFYNIVVATSQHYEIKLFEHHHVASLILQSARKSLRMIYLLVVLHIIISMIGLSKNYLIMANDIINIIIIASIGWIAIQILYTFDAIAQQQMLIGNNDRRRAKSLYTKAHILRNILTVVIVLITLAAILMTFGSVRNIGISLLASAGFLTAIIGLASQKTLSSLFTGLQIAISQPIKIGDVVVIENQTGIVEEISFTYVVMKVAENRRMILPIQYFIEKPFINWSHDPEGMRNSINFHVDYMMPIQPLREHFNNILSASRFWDGKVCKLHVINLTDRTAELQVVISAANENDLSDLSSEVREKMLGFIRENYPEYFPALRSRMDQAAMTT